ncbi:hypothetical protein OnM2_052052 [Erysiphe neolycopersici]|uniref:Uncharacterized protein n=1 Tax=Erysiphe neolycopersici TaxID=212602 RepID=A0A420HS95_9PEZI|nr:hypothetical protein OnM2_052052 [Erysiphe neolycopersici]
MAVPALPEFSTEHHFDGSVSASRLLDQISFQFEIAGNTNPPPAIMLRVINILCTGDAAN